MVLGEDAPRIGPGPVNNWLFERKVGGGRPTAPTNYLEERRTPMTAPVYSTEMPPRPAVTSRVAATGPMTSVHQTAGSSGKLPPAISASTEGDKSASPPVLAGSMDDSPIVAYHESEMSGGSWSDSYSFLAEGEFSSDKSHARILRNFETLGGPSAMGAAAAAAAPATKQSAKEAALLREFEAYTAGRDREIGPSIKRS